jgi:hypothetical protein
MPTSTYSCNKFLNDFFTDVTKRTVTSSSGAGIRTFNTGDYSAPPGDKYLQYNNADASLVTEMYVDLTNTEGDDESDFLSALSGYIIVTDYSNPTIYQVFEVSAMGPMGAYDTFSVTFKFGSATPPTGKVVLAQFDSVWFGLSTALLTPASTGATASEPATADGYLRQPVFIGISYWTTATTASTANKTDIAFEQSTDIWGTIQTMFIVNDPDRGQGNIFWYYPLNPSLTVQKNTVVNFQADSVVVSMT